MYAFVTLVISVVLVILSRYAAGAESVLGSSFVYALAFVYVPFAFRADALRSFEGATPLAVGVRRAPHIAAVGLAAWHAATWDGRSLSAAGFDSAAYSVGISLGLVGNHLVMTAGVAAALWLADRGLAAVAEPASTAR